MVTPSPLPHCAAGVQLMCPFASTVDYDKLLKFFGVSASSLADNPPISWQRCKPCMLHNWVNTTDHRPPAGISCMTEIPSLFGVSACSLSTPLPISWQPCKCLHMSQDHCLASALLQG